MVVHDFDVNRASAGPFEADPPLVVDADAVLAGSGALEGFEPVAGRDSQIGKDASPVQHGQLPHGHCLEGRESQDPLPLEEGLRVVAHEGLDGHR